MALWTEFLKQQREAEQTARARGRQEPTSAAIAGAARPIAETALAEERGISEEAGRELGREVITTRGERFKDVMSLGRERLEQRGRASDIETELGEERLSGVRSELSHMRRMRPWAIGLGAGEIITADYQRRKQAERDRVLDERLFQILGGGRRDTPERESETDYTLGLPRRHGREY